MQRRGDLHVLFDEDWYRNSGATFEGDAFEHFRTVGWRQHRDPHPLFDVAFYLRQLPSPLAGDSDPLTHFVDAGADAGLDPHPLFDVRFYMTRYENQVGGRNPLAHYADAGGHNGLDPHLFFVSSYYLEENADVRAAGLNPLTHYVAFGGAERRRAHPAINLDAYARCRALPAGANPLIDFTLRMRAMRGRTLAAASAAGRPDLSVIIVNYNKSLMTLQCLLEVVGAHGDDPAVEIVVMDNGSHPLDFTHIAPWLPIGVRVVRSGVNRFFSEGNNIAVEASSGRLLLFLNNDAFIGAETVPALRRALEERPDAGAVGPKFIYPDGRIQEAGASITSCGTAVQHGKYLEDPPGRFDRTRAVDYVSAACMLMPRELYDEAGGFDGAWDPAYYEDVDLCLKIERLGKRTYYCHDALVVHIENGTSSDPGLRLNDVVEVNRDKFIERWGKYLDGDRRREKPGARVSARPRPPSAPPARVAVLYTPYSLVPGGGERYLLSMAEHLAERYTTYLVTPDRYSNYRLQAIGAALELDLAEVRMLDMPELPRYADCDLFIGNGNEALPSVRPVGKRRIYVCQFPFPMHAEHAARAWGRLDDFDSVVVYSDYAARHFRQRAAALARRVPPTVIVPPPCPMYHDVGARRPGRILSIGRFTRDGHCKRQDVLIDAFGEVVRRSGATGLELHLAGSLPTDAESRAFVVDLKRRARDLPVYFHLSCTAATIRNLCETSSYYWHATGFGTSEALFPERQEHFGISVVEAMSAGGIPLVYAGGGPADIVANGSTGWHWRTVNELVERQLLALAQAPSLLQRMSDAAKSSARKYDRFAFRRRLDHVLAPQEPPVPAVPVP